MRLGHYRAGRKPTLEHASLRGARPRTLPEAEVRPGDALRALRAQHSGPVVGRPEGGGDLVQIDRG
jgi:hypothetical protein